MKVSELINVLRDEDQNATLKVSLPSGVVPENPAIYKVPITTFGYEKDEDPGNVVVLLIREE